MTYEEFAKKYKIQMIQQQDGQIYFNAENCNTTFNLAPSIELMIGMFNCNVHFSMFNSEYYISPLGLLEIITQYPEDYMCNQAKWDLEVIGLRKPKNNEDISVVIKLQRVNGEFMITVPIHAKERVKKLLTAWIDSN